jgi:3-oxoacyl-[acyl-carrier-protein] synthase-3
MKTTARQAHSVCIAGTGSYLPAKILTNEDLSKMVDTTNEWILTRTGIRERHIAGPEEAASHMGAQAAKRALESAGVAAGDVDLIIVATITQDMSFPSTACLVQDMIGAGKAWCFDLHAACAGFLYAIQTARQYIVSGAADTVLVVGTEKLSAITDWQDRATCVLFGDGAGAVVLRPGPPGRHGIISSVMGSDGSLADLLKIPGGGSRIPSTKESVEQRLHYIKMEGREVFKHAVRCMSEAARQALENSELTMDDIRCVIPHQANARIIQAIAEKLGVPPDRFYMNLERVGNMSGASIPVALDEAVRSGRIRPGDRLLLVAFGGGFTWGASVVQWEKTR